MQRVFNTSPILATVVLGTMTAFAPWDAAEASVIDFEGESGSVYSTGDSLEVDGFNFELTKIAGGFLGVTDQVNIVESSSTKLVAYNHAEVTMTRDGGGAFSLVSLDLGGTWADHPYRWADQVQITANLVGGGIYQTLVDLPDSLTSYVTATLNLTDVLSVNFSAYGSNGTGQYDYEFTLDNIEVNSISAIPLPASLPLLAFAFGGLGVLARRKTLGG